MFEPDPALASHSEIPDVSRFGARLAMVQKYQLVADDQVNLINFSSVIGNITPNGVSECEASGNLSGCVWIFSQCRGVGALVVLIVVGSPALPTLAIMRSIVGDPRYLCNLYWVEYLEAVTVVPAFRRLGASTWSVGQIHTHLAL